MLARGHPKAPALQDFREVNSHALIFSHYSEANFWYLMLKKLYNIFLYPRTKR